ncbi:MAG: hypothetical protein ACXWRE_04145 [Pseudobdellovibrionaceae bacterium]
MSIFFRLQSISIVLIGSVGVPSFSWAAVLNAASCSLSDVQNAISSATDKDTVTVPAGNCVWNAVLDLGSKAITLQGAGIGKTNITHNVSGSQVKLIQFTEHSTLSTRVVGFSFLGGTYDHRFIGCSGNGDYTSAPMRLDHNSFTSGGGAVQVDLFSCRGLIDHNTFAATDNSEMIHNWGPGLSGWSVDVAPGSTNALYLENNTFNNGTAGNWGAQSAIQSYDAARIVARYNTFNDNQVDTHGGSNIGTRWFEFYENTFNTSFSSWEQAFDIRAGSGVIFNNHKTGVANNPAIMLRYECRPGDAGYRVGEGWNRANWSPVYIWGNDSSLPVDYATGAECTGVSIQPGVNFIATSTQPSSMKIWQKSVDNSNTTYSYVPFSYPYPLDANGYPNLLAINTLQPPMNLRMVL